MLASHLFHLCTLTSQIDNTIDPNDYTQIKDRNNKIHNLHKQDLKQGKILVRQTDNKRTNLTNIRHLLENMTITDLGKYNIGLGAATTRTTQQKNKAKLLTQQIIKKIKTNIIVVDGSIHGNKQKKMGGYGGIIISKNRNNKKTFSGRAKTGDPQQAELAGINEAITQIQLHEAHKKNPEHYTILCDCKNAVNYVKEIYTPPLKYTSTIQAIQEKKLDMQNIKINIDIQWIPGHTDNEWNDEADTLAKAAAKSWKNQPHRLGGLPREVLSVLPLSGGTD